MRKFVSIPFFAVTILLTLVAASSVYLSLLVRHGCIEGQKKANRLGKYLDDYEV
jgi:uncharacterized membrane protein YhaH (DUF805 family)